MFHGSIQILLSSWTWRPSSVRRGFRPSRIDFDGVQCSRAEDDFSKAWIASLPAPPQHHQHENSPCYGNGQNVRSLFRLMVPYFRQMSIIFVFVFISYISIFLPNAEASWFWFSSIRSIIPSLMNNLVRLVGNLLSWVTTTMSFRSCAGLCDLYDFSTEVLLSSAPVGSSAERIIRGRVIRARRWLHRCFGTAAHSLLACDVPSLEAVCRGIP